MKCKICGKKLSSEDYQFTKRRNETKCVKYILVRDEDEN